MKRILIICLLLLSALVKAQVKHQIIRFDTMPGHGYEIMFVGKSRTWSVTKSDGGIDSGSYYRPFYYTWPDAKRKIDSIYNLKQRWQMVSVAQLRTIYNITQPIADRKGIRIGNSDFEGIHGLFWCNNSPDGSLEDLDKVAIAGSQNNKEFVVTDEHCKETVKVSTNGRDLAYSELLLFVRKY